MVYYLTFVRMTLTGKKKNKKQKTINRDFPGGPVVKTPCFQNAGDMGLVAGLGIKIPHTPLSMAK